MFAKEQSQGLLKTVGHELETLPAITLVLRDVIGAATWTLELIEFSRDSIQSERSPPPIYKMRTKYQMLSVTSITQWATEPRRCTSLFCTTNLSVLNSVALDLWCRKEKYLSLKDPSLGRT